MAESLAVKYRPKDWTEVCGQSSIIKILQRQLDSDQIKNCLLFCGSSGCGKTTAARILANNKTRRTDCAWEMYVFHIKSSGFDGDKLVQRRFYYW